MVSPEARSAVGIRKFLEYYILAVLNEGSATGEEIIETIEQNSADNKKYRPEGTLRIAEIDLKQVIQTLVRRHLVKSDEQGEYFTLTDKGNEAFQRMGKRKKLAKNSKEEATARLISILVKEAGKGAKEKYVLDVGTGEGYLAFKLADARFKVLGIDSGGFEYSRNTIKEATRKARGNSNLDFRKVDVDELGLKEAFDCVVSSQAVHCMKDQKRSICAIYRLLKKGGLFVSSDLRVGLRGFFLHGFHSFLALSKEEWTEILSSCGYVNIKMHEVNDFCVVEARRSI